MDEIQLRKFTERASRAKQLMEDEMVVEALTTIRSNLHSIWESSKHEEERQREEAWKMLKIMNEFERFFLKVMEDGKIAQKELSTLEKMKEKVKSYF